jgi:hypothetical protein
LTSFKPMHPSQDNDISPERVEPFQGLSVPENFFVPEFQLLDMIPDLLQSLVDRVGNRRGEGLILLTSYRLTDIRRVILPLL